MQSFDIVIAGGGMVGLALACGLQDSGLRIAVIESNREAVERPLTGVPELRVSAINAASERLLQSIGVWNEILSSQRASAYSSMSVWDKDSFGEIGFDVADFGYPHLGHIVENHLIQQALWRRAGQLSDITLLAPAEIQQVAWGENEAFITLKDGGMMSARLVIAADGARSWLRQHADIPLTFWDYGHHAMVATIRTALPHGRCARQIFHGDGILAFLPLWQPDRCSIVWSLPPESAERLQALPTEQFNRELSVAFDMRLGLCKLESERLLFPLTARYARDFAAHRLVLMGDAAHTIHPLAGQGVNLGFMDIAELIAEVKRLRREGKDIGAYHYLRRYERRRKHDAAKMLAAMQGFRTLFDGSHPAKKLFRDIGMKVADTLPGVKKKMLHQAMGLNDLPDWLA